MHSSDARQRVFRKRSTTRRGDAVEAIARDQVVYGHYVDAIVRYRIADREDYRSDLMYPWRTQAGPGEVEQPGVLKRRGVRQPPRRLSGYSLSTRPTVCQFVVALVRLAPSLPIRSSLCLLQTLISRYAGKCVLLPSMLLFLLFLSGL